MADRGFPLMVYLSETEKNRLGMLCEKTERDQSKMVRFLINREFNDLFPLPLAATVSAETLPSAEVE